MIKIAIASGKGGTGKTLISSNLANVAAQKQMVRLYDLDVEEPNAHLFFDTTVRHEQTVKNMIPIVHDDRCDYCGVCSEICAYNAIVTLKNQVLVFPELCHSCYGCLELCPQKAISEGFKPIGRITDSTNKRLRLISGELRLQEMATTALIKETKRSVQSADDIAFYDAPPGTACPVIETLKDADYVVLVTEPTPFGRHDLDLMAQTVRQLKPPFGVIVNKAVTGNRLIEMYCEQEGIEIIGRIPQDMEIARAYAKGELVSEQKPEWKDLFEELFVTIRNKVNKKTVSF